MDIAVDVNVVEVGAPQAVNEGAIFGSLRAWLSEAHPGREAPEGRVPRPPKMATEMACGDVVFFCNFSFWTSKRKVKRGAGAKAPRR